MGALLGYVQAGYDYTAGLMTAVMGLIG